MSQQKGKRLLLITNLLCPPYDEGLHVWMHSFHESLTNRDDWTIFVINQGMNQSPLIVRTKLLAKSIAANKKYSPDVILYVPGSSMTFMSFLTIGLMKLFCGKNLNFFAVSLQQKRLNKLQLWITRSFLQPRTVFSQMMEDVERKTKQGLRYHMRSEERRVGKECRL